MISMVHRDGGTTIQMVQIDDHFEVSLQLQGDDTVRTWEYDDLQAALAGYVLTITGEIGLYVGHDLPWYSAVNDHALGKKPHRDTIATTPEQTRALRHR